MNAVQFIKENGVEKARGVVDLAPQGATHLSNDTRHYVNADFKPLPTHIKEQLPKLIVIEHLKRLVASVDLVKSFGGIANAQEDELWANELGFGYKGLKHAIADYEEIFGGEHV